MIKYFWDYLKYANVSFVFPLQDYHVYFHCDKKEFKRIFKYINGMFKMKGFLIVLFSIFLYRWYFDSNAMS